MSSPWFVAAMVIEIEEDGQDSIESSRHDDE
jgi:hypothetical protein